MNIEKLGNNIWTTKDSRRLKWCNMEIRHLRNTAALLRRTGNRIVAEAFMLSAIVQGDMASMAADAECDYAIQHEASYSEIAKHMEIYANWREKTT